MYYSDVILSKKTYKPIEIGSSYYKQMFEELRE